MKKRTLNGVDAMRVAVSPIRDVKVRESGSPDTAGSWTIEGYAAVTEQETTLYDLSWIRVREEIARGAFLPELVEEVTNDPESVAAGAPLWDEKWRILEIKDLYDVCACPQGAYAQTEAFIRTMAAGSLTRSGITVPDLGRAARAKRADVVALDCLVEAYQAVEEFIAVEGDPEDAADVEKANGILAQLDEL